MRTLVITKETQDFKTGEIVTKEIFKKEVANKDQFIRTYLDDIGSLVKCSNSEKSVILCSLQYLDYATNEIILTPSRRKDVAACSGVKLDTMSTAISRLMKKEILIKKSGSTYILNPKIFFYGKDIDRAKVIQATITYKISPIKTPE